LEQLTHLTLDGNQLPALPSTLSKLPSLTYLSVNNNPRLSSLDVLDGSTSLVTLQGSNCLLDHLPTNIRNLRTIELNGNLLTSLFGIETITSSPVICFHFHTTISHLLSVRPWKTFKQLSTSIYP
jgi:Leucine-rich repeat (LRR) protein